MSDNENQPTADESVAFRVGPDGDDGSVTAGGEVGVPEGSDQRRTVRLARGLLILTTASSVMLVLWVTNSVRYLRPSVDDYCIAARAGQGVIGGFVDDWQTYSGFITPSFLTNALVGVPLVRLPLWAASGLPFMLAALVVALLLIVMSGQLMARPTMSRRWPLALMAVPIGMASWWAFLWTSYSSSGQSTPEDVTLGVTHWQNLNTAYVIPVSLILAFALILYRSRITRTWLAVVAAGCLGLAIGFMGPSFALAVVTFAPAGLVVLWLVAPWEARRVSIRTVAVIVFSLVGLAVAMAAPGTRARAEDQLDSSFSLGPGTLPAWIMTLFPDIYQAWAQAFLSWGALLIFIMAVLLGTVVQSAGVALRRERLGAYTVALLGFGLALSAATLIGDKAAYGAYWHQTSVKVVVFAATVAAGLWLASALRNLRQPWWTAVVVCGVVAAVTCYAGAVLDMTSNIAEREQRWSVGPAPVGDAIDDRELPGLNECWQKVVSLRG